MLLQFRALGVTMSWDEGFLGARASRLHNDGCPGARASRPHNDGFPGARASRPHQAWHSLGHLPHLDQPATAPCLSFGLAAAVHADRVAACSIALRLSGGQSDRMRAGRPRSQEMPSPPWRADHSRVKQRVLMPIRSRGHVPFMRFAASLNIDTQDRQDKQDEKLLHKKLTGSIIECAFVENLSVLRGPSWTPFEPSPTPSWPFAVLRGPSWISFCLFVEIFSPLPTFGGSLLSFLQPLRGPSSSFVPLRGFLFFGLCG